MKKRMKKNGVRPIRTHREPSKVFLSVLCLALAGLNASADTLTWDPGSTGTGSAGTGNWSDATWATGSGDGVWVDGNDATIGGDEASSVTLDHDVSGGTLTINNTGGNSSITGSAYNLFFDTYNVTGGAGLPTVFPLLNWANGFTLTGGGILTAGTGYSGAIGNIVIDNGTLRLNAVNNLSGGSITVNAGGIFQTTSTAGANSNITGPVILHGGQLQGNSNSKSLNISSVTLASGQNTFANPVNATALTRTSADISTGTGGGTLYIQVNNSTTLGTINGVAAPVSSPTTSGFIGGWAVTYYGTTGFAVNTGSSIVADNAANANYDVDLYQIDDSSGTDALDHALASSNVLLAGSVATAQIVSGDKTINSLTFDQTGTTTLNGLLTVNSGGILGNAQASHISGSGGAITSGFASGELFVHTAWGLTISVPIINNGGTNVSLIKDGSSVLTLEGNSTYTGGTFINAGTLQMGVANAIPIGEGVVLENGNGAVLDLHNYSQTVGALWGGGSKGGNITLGNAGTTVLTVQGNAAGTAVYRGAISGSGAVTKDTTNIQTLSGANSYSGDTNVNAGKLFITGNVGGTATVAAGAVLGIGEQNAVGSFTTGQVALVAGATAANSSGLAFTLGGDNLTLGTAGVDWSQLTATADEGFYISGEEGSKIFLSLSGAGLYGSTFDTTVNHEWDNFIITGGDTSENGWASFFQIGDVIGLNGALAGSFSVLSDADGNLDLHYEAVPEPSTWILLAGGTGLLLFWKKRRAALAA